MLNRHIGIVDVDAFSAESICIEFPYCSDGAPFFLTAFNPIKNDNEPHVAAKYQTEVSKSNINTETRNFTKFCKVSGIEYILETINPFLIRCKYSRDHAKCQDLRYKILKDFCEDLPAI